MTDSRVMPRYPSLKQVDKRLWELLAPVMHNLKGFRPFTVPAGETTDGASVPRPFWPICPPMSNYTNAAVLHDYLYKCARTYGEPLEGYEKKKTCDDLFLAAMEDLGVSRWQRRVMYRAVRLAFWNDWK